MTRSRWILTVALSIAATVGTLVPASSQAATASATLTVHAHVVRNCIIRAVTVDFGDYDPVVANAQQPLDAVGAIEVNCSKGITPKVTLGVGANAAGQTRRMKSGNEYLEYELYSDISHATIWGTGTDAKTFHTSTGPSITRIEMVYGRAVGGQNLPAGDYNDTVTATVIF